MCWKRINQLLYCHQGRWNSCHLIIFLFNCKVKDLSESQSNFHCLEWNSWYKNSYSYILCVNKCMQGKVNACVWSNPILYKLQRVVGALKVQNLFVQRSPGSVWAGRARRSAQDDIRQQSRQGYTTIWSPTIWSGRVDDKPTETVPRVWQKLW